jgi:hypothetical protein
MTLARGVTASPHQPGLGEFDQQVPLELREGVQHPHDHSTGCAGQVGTAKLKAVNTNPDIEEPDR